MFLIQCMMLIGMDNIGIPIAHTSRDISRTAVGQTLASRSSFERINRQLGISQDGTLLTMGSDRFVTYSLRDGHRIGTDDIFRFSNRSAAGPDFVAYNESQAPKVPNRQPPNQASWSFDPVFLNKQRAFAISSSGAMPSGKGYGLYAIMRLEERGSRPNAVGYIESGSANARMSRILFKDAKTVVVSWTKGRWAKTNREARTVIHYRFTDTGTPKLKIEKLSGFTVPNPSPKEPVTRIWQHDVARQTAVFQTGQGFYFYVKGHKPKRLPERVGPLQGTELILLRGRVFASNLVTGKLAFLNTAKMEWNMVDGENYLLAISPDEDQLLLVRGPEKRVLLVDLD